MKTKEQVAQEFKNELQALLNKYGASLEAEDHRITKLEDMLFERGAMNEPPCFCCGYNGPGYYQPATHPCAERHHRLSR